MPDSASTRVAVVTGVSRQAGIGFAIARQLLPDGYGVLVHSWAPHDAEHPWGGEPIDGVIDALGGVGPCLRHVEADLADPAAPAELIAEAVRAFGAIDVVVANHARSSNQSLDEVTA